MSPLQLRGFLVSNIKPELDFKRYRHSKKAQHRLFYIRLLKKAGLLSPRPTERTNGEHLHYRHHCLVWEHRTGGEEGSLKSHKDCRADHWNGTLSDGHVIQAALQKNEQGALSETHSARLTHGTAGSIVTHKIVFFSWWLKQNKTGPSFLYIKLCLEHFCVQLYCVQCIVVFILLCILPYHYLVPFLLLFYSDLLSYCCFIYITRRFWPLPRMPLCPDLSVVHKWRINFLDYWLCLVIWGTGEGPNGQIVLRV